MKALDERKGGKSTIHLYASHQPKQTSDRVTSQTANE
jgi:hypothetical protein